MKKIKTLLLLTFVLCTSKIMLSQKVSRFQFSENEKKYFKKIEKITTNEGISPCWRRLEIAEGWIFYPNSEEKNITSIFISKHVWNNQTFWTIEISKETESSVSLEKILSDMQL